MSLAADRGDGILRRFDAIRVRRITFTRAPEEEVPQAPIATVHIPPDSASTDPDASFQARHSAAADRRNRGTGTTP